MTENKLALIVYQYKFTELQYRHWTFILHDIFSDNNLADDTGILSRFLSINGGCIFYSFGELSSSIESIGRQGNSQWLFDCAQAQMMAPRKWEKERERPRDATLCFASEVALRYNVCVCVYVDARQVDSESSKARWYKDWHRWVFTIWRERLWRETNIL